MHIANATLTVNAAFMQEIKEVNQELWLTMEKAESVCGSLEPHPHKVVAILGELRDQIALHFALEEAYGYFEGPVTVAPRLCEQADRLRSQHQTLYRCLDCLVEDAEDWHHKRQLPKLHHVVADRLCEFHAQLREHENRESELILEAYDDDIGVGD